MYMLCVLAVVPVIYEWGARGCCPIGLSDSASCRAPTLSTAAVRAAGERRWRAAAPLADDADVDARAITPKALAAAVVEDALDVVYAFAR